MPSINKSLLVLAVISQIVLVTAAPVPQIAGEGSACDSILTDFDSGTGYATKNIEEGLANDISGKTIRRQIAGEGSACGSVLTDFDSGTGYATKNIEEGLAGDIKGAATPAAPQKRQLNKIANGASDLLDAANLQGLANPVKTYGDDIDGDLTNAAADAGANIGSAYENTVEGATADVFNNGDNTANGGGGGGGSGAPPAGPPPPAGPRSRKRQLNKIANGASDLLDAANLQGVAKPVKTYGDDIDGELTNTAANAGAEIGSAYENTVEGATSEIFNNGDKTSSGDAASGPPVPAGPGPH